MPITNTLQLAFDLISRPSVTPDDADCQKIIRNRLESIGFDCQTLFFGEGEDKVENLWAIYGNEGPIFCFAGHTDVVPTGPAEEWKTPPFKPTIKDGYLFGRGAADMKGSLAAMITACEQFITNNKSFNGRIAFLITADEEGPAKNGTVKVMEWLESNQVKLCWCLVGEPSSTDKLGDTIKNGRRGSLSGKLKVIGKQGHVAYPHLAENPIHQLTPALAELTQEVWDEGNDFFPATSFQISNILSGTGATNVIPGAIEALFNFRFSTENTANALKQRTETILRKYELNYHLEWNLSGEPFLTSEGLLVEASKKAIQDVCGYTTQLSTAGGTSDGRFIAPTGAQVVELGPLNATIHQTDECVKADDLNQLSDIYLEILNHIFNQ